MQDFQDLRSELQGSHKYASDVGHHAFAAGQAGADLTVWDADRYNAVTIASVADEDTLRLLLRRGASARLVTGRYEDTARIAAAHLGHLGVVRQLIAAGAQLDHVNNLRWTAVIESIMRGDGDHRHQAVLHALIEASLALTDRKDASPLKLAPSQALHGYGGRTQRWVHSDRYAVISRG